LNDKTRVSTGLFQGKEACVLITRRLSFAQACGEGTALKAPPTTNRSTPTESTMVLILSLAERPACQLDVAGLAFDAQGRQARQGAVNDGAPPGAPVSEWSRA
jgi:hypothetical protein